MLHLSHYLIQFLQLIHIGDAVIHDQAELSLEPILLYLLVVRLPCQLGVVNCHHVLMLVGR